MKLFLASANPHKAAEFKALSGSLPAAVEVLSATEVGGMPAVVEDTGTFEGNALKKAKALHARLPPGAWALADDSGLCVEFLNGAPGVESAYYAGPKGDPAANLAKLVDVMRSVPHGRRSAAFVCVLALCGPGGVERLFLGRCEGRLELEPRGGGGFGYDPLFVPHGLDTTFAQLAAEVKNRISHRGLAWAQCVGWLAARG